jgi:hypothetical protein
MEVKPIVVAVPRIGDARGALEHRERGIRASQHGADGKTRRTCPDDQRVAERA